MINKINVGIIFGGRSAEHEVSINSARNVYNALDEKKFNVTLIGIEKNGAWSFGQNAQQLLEQKFTSLPNTKDNSLTYTTHLPSQNELKNIDVFFPIPSHWLLKTID